MTDKNTLTPVELEFMEVLWQKGKGTVREVMAGLSAKRKLAYTSVSTILRILEQKKIVITKKFGREHIYLPALSKEKFASYIIKKILKQVFTGDRVEMASYLININDLSLEEIEAIEKIIVAKKQTLKS